MKLYITALLLILTIGLSAQTTDSLGLNDNPWLTKYESEYFNNQFKNQRNDFDFMNKKIAFVTGSSGSRHLTKTDYFEDIKSGPKDNEIADTPIFLTQEEKVKSGGYDVIMLSWVKLLTEKRRRQIVDELKAASR
jgi:hypothetical protein